MTWINTSAPVSDGPARYIGRVGALAVALGIGAALATGAGVASAGTGDTETSAPSDAGPRQTTDRDEPGPSQTKTSADDTADPGGDDAAAGDHGDEPPAETHGDRDDEAAEDGLPVSDAHTSRHAGLARHEEPDADLDPTQEEPGAAETATAPGAVATPEAGTEDLAVPPDEEPPHDGPAHRRVVTEVLPAAVAPVADDSHLTDTPASPVQSWTLTGLLELVRREVEYRLFNRSPVATYDSSQNTQSADGQVTGQVVGADADDDILSYSIVGKPKRGSVTVAADGTFTYVPDPATAADGGSDIFTVKVSDLRGNPAHIHGLATFLAPHGGAALADVTVLVAPPGASETSPLATADQIAAEKLATQIVKSPFVKLAKFVLKIAWTLAAKKQFAMIGGPDAKNMAQLDQAVDEYALQAAFELLLLNPNSPKVIQQVMPPHTWFGQSFGGARILYDNPDTIYRMIPVNNSSSYVISGRFAGPMPADTTFSVLTGLTGTTTAVLSGNDLVRAADGSFTITVDSRATDPDNPNHLQLPTGATLIAARNTLSDWNIQEPMSLSVRRIAGPKDNLFSQLGLYDIPVVGPALTGSPLISALMSIVPPLHNPPMALRAAETAIIMCLGLIMEPQYMAVATTDPATGDRKAPNVFTDPVHNASFLATQLQSAGYFQLADDEALVITIDPGNAGYFGVPVTNLWTVTDNYWDVPTSLNIAQSHRNSDGTYTMVVSPTDPGVQNWVSTGGLNQGTVSIRFQDLGSNALADPTVSTRVVKSGHLLDEFPELVAQPADEAFRSAQKSSRQTGYANRYAPYPLA